MYFAIWFYHPMDLSKTAYGIFKISYPKRHRDSIKTFIGEGQSQTISTYKMRDTSGCTHREHRQTKINADRHPTPPLQRQQNSSGARCYIEHHRFSLNRSH
jgi:hypothetical protein